MIQGLILLTVLILMAVSYRLGRLDERMAVAESDILRRLDAIIDRATMWDDAPRENKP